MVYYLHLNINYNKTLKNNLLRGMDGLLLEFI